jgi:hypothetical protein
MVIKYEMDKRIEEYKNSIGRKGSEGKNGMEI